MTHRHCDNRPASSFFFSAPNTAFTFSRKTSRYTSAHPQRIFLGPVGKNVRRFSVGIFRNVADLAWVPRRKKRNGQTTQTHALCQSASASIIQPRHRSTCSGRLREQLPFHDHVPTVKAKNHAYAECDLFGNA